MARGTGSCRSAFVARCSTQRRSRRSFGSLQKPATKSLPSSALLKQCSAFWSGGSADRSGFHCRGSRLSAGGRPFRGEKEQSMPEAVKKVVLAYSGGLDTSVILRWLQQGYR